MGDYKIAVIGGDGIGPEVTDEALKVVRATGVAVETKEFELGARHYVETGEVLTEETLDDLRNFDAILLGAIGPAIGSKEVPPGILERGLLLKLRFALDLYINLRPFSGTKSSLAKNNELYVVRENTEGPYAGEGGQLRPGTPFEVATQGSVNTYHGVERCVRFAFELARDTKRKNLTLVHKTNVLVYAGSLWQRIFEETAKEFGDVETSYCHVDAATIYLVTDPGRFGVMVTDNLFGDILTDLAGAVYGGIGLAASANLNPARTGPSLFEPVHGAAHDIAGQNKANPLGAIRSAAMMLRHLGESEAAKRVEDAVLGVSDNLDNQAERLSTADIGDAVAERV